MSQDAERTRKLIDFQKRLEKRVEDLESELKEQTAVLETVNSILLEKGFRRAEIPKDTAVANVAPPPSEENMPEPAPSQAAERHAGFEEIIELKTSTGVLLGSLYVGEQSLRVVPAEDKAFNVNTSPFSHFLVERVLTKMQERDSELARTGHLEPDQIFSYSITRDDDVIREIVIRNVDAERLKELKSSIRWTLEKMYEKMKDQA